MSKITCHKICMVWLTVLLSILEFNLCSTFFVSVKMGLMNDGIVPSKKSRAYFQSQKLNNKIQFPFWYVSLFIQCLKVENMLSSQVTLLILGFCTLEKNGRILSCRQQQKMLARQVH